MKLIIYYGDFDYKYEMSMRDMDSALYVGEKALKIMEEGFYVVRP